MNSAKEHELYQEAVKIAECNICKENKTGLAVPGEGSSSARIVFVGEAPGKQEAKTGRPFIGRAGNILRALIKEIGLSEQDVFITSAVKYLPDYGTPKIEDIEHGRVHLFNQLDIIKPKVVVLLGAVAVFAVLDRKVTVFQEHGKFFKKDGRSYFITFHPAAPLYAPAVRKFMVADFNLLKQCIAGVL